MFPLESEFCSVRDQTCLAQLHSASIWQMRGTVLAPNYSLSSWNALWGFLNVPYAFVNKPFLTRDCWGGTESQQRLSGHLTVKFCKEKSLRTVPTSYQYPSGFLVGILIASLWTPPSNLPRYFRVTFDTPTTYYLPLFGGQWGQTWQGASMGGWDSCEGWGDPSHSWWPALWGLESSSPCILKIIGNNSPGKRIDLPRESC